AIGRVLGPVGLAAAVGIAGLGEVRPVRHHCVAQLAVLVANLPLGARVERSENIFDIVGVKGERAGMKLAGGGGKFEMIAVHGGVAGLEMRLEPSPGAESDELIAAEIEGGAQRLGIVLCR